MAEGDGGPSRWLGVDPSSSFAAVLTRSPDTRSDRSASPVPPAPAVATAPSTSRSVWAPTLDAGMSAQDFFADRSLFPALSALPAQLQEQHQQQQQHQEAAEAPRRRRVPRRRAEVVVLSPSPEPDRGPSPAVDFVPLGDSVDATDEAGGTDLWGPEAVVEGRQRTGRSGRSTRSQSRSSRHYSPPPELPPTPPLAAAGSRARSADSYDGNELDGDGSSGNSEAADQETLFLTALRSGEDSRRRRRAGAAAAGGDEAVLRILDSTSLDPTSLDVVRNIVEANRPDLLSLVRPDAGAGASAAEAAGIRSPLSPSASPPPLRAFEPPRHLPSAPASPGGRVAHPYGASDDVFARRFRDAIIAGRQPPPPMNLRRPRAPSAKPGHLLERRVYVLFCGRGAGDRRRSSALDAVRPPRGFTYTSSSDGRRTSTTGVSDAADGGEEGCGALLCVRGMDIDGWPRHIPSWSTDAAPVPGRVGTLDVAVSKPSLVPSGVGSSSGTARANVCECDRQQIGCLHCGHVVGYLPRAGCSLCTSSINSEHRVRFLKSAVRAVPRLRDTDAGVGSRLGSPVLRPVRGSTAAAAADLDLDDDEEECVREEMRWMHIPTLEQDREAGLIDDPAVWADGVLTLRTRPSSSDGGHPLRRTRTISLRRAREADQSGESSTMGRLQAVPEAERRAPSPQTAAAPLFGRALFARFPGIRNAEAGPPIPVLEPGGDHFDDEDDGDDEGVQALRTERASSTQPLVRGTSLSRSPALRLPRLRSDRWHPATGAADSAAAPGSDGALLGPFPTSHARRRRSRVFEVDELEPEPADPPRPTATERTVPLADGVSAHTNATLYDYAVQALRSSQDGGPGGLAASSRSSSERGLVAAPAVLRDEEELWRECWPRQRRRTARDLDVDRAPHRFSSVGVNARQFMWTGDVCAR